MIRRELITQPQLMASLEQKCDQFLKHSGADLMALWEWKRRVWNEASREECPVVARETQAEAEKLLEEIIEQEEEERTE